MNPQPHGYPKSARILKRNEYLALQRSPLRVVTENFIIYGRKRRRRIARVGITVSKKVGNAVVRNRVKRLVRETFRMTRDVLPPDLDFVLVARRQRPIKTLEETQRQFLEGAEQLRVLYISRQKSVPTAHG